MYSQVSFLFSEVHKNSLVLSEVKTKVSVLGSGLALAEMRLKKSAQANYLARMKHTETAEEQRKRYDIMLSKYMARQIQHEVTEMCEDWQVGNTQDERSSRRRARSSTASRRGSQMLHQMSSSSKSTRASESA